MLINKNNKVSTSEKTIKKVVKLMLKLYLDNDTLMKKATPVGFEPTLLKIGNHFIIRNHFLNVK